MGERFAIFAPTVLTIALIGYLCWPYIDPAVPPQANEQKLPEIAASVLHPKLEDAGKKDPFGESIAFNFDAPAADKNKPGKGPAATSGAKPATKPHGADAQTLAAKPAQPGTTKPSGTKPAATGTQLVKTTPGTAGAAAGPQPTPLSELVLGATYLQGDQQMALIGGRTYTRGQAVNVADYAPGTLRIAEIQRYKVVLEHQGKKIDLNYQNVSKRRDKPQVAAKSGAPKSGAAKTGAAKSGKTPAKTASTKKPAPKNAAAKSAKPAQDQGGQQ